MRCDSGGRADGSAPGSGPEPDCCFRTIRRYFEGPVTARCQACGHLVRIEEVGDQEVTMPCGATWALNLRSIIGNGG